MFNWFRKPKAAPQTPPKIPVYGQKVGNLTRFGTTWLDLSQIQLLEFYDGAGAEVLIGREAWTLSNEDASALEEYLLIKAAL